MDNNLFQVIDIEIYYKFMYIMYLYCYMCHLCNYNINSSISEYLEIIKLLDELLLFYFLMYSTI